MPFKKFRLCFWLLVSVNVCNAQRYTVFEGVNRQTKKEIQKLLKISPKALDKAFGIIKSSENGYVTGWSAQYYHVLPGLIKQFNLRKGCEIGVAFGSHIEYILEHTNVEKLYGVDAYLGKHLWGPLKSCAEILYYLVKKRLSRWEPRFTLKRGLSHEIAKEFQPGEFDFIFIDAEHSYEDVKLDLQSWYNKVRSGGLVAGDDYTEEFPGLVKAVDEFFNEKNLKINRSGDRDRIWWLIKP